MYIISECECCLHHFTFREYRYRLLYAGNNLNLSKVLKETLLRLDCFVVRAPRGYVASVLIKHINYSLLLFDQVLPDMTARELTKFTRVYREETPIITYKQSEDFDSVLRVMTRLLGRLMKEMAVEVV